jgi:rubrerythrin
MNEEVDSLECSAANLRDFPQAAWELRFVLARQCADEARHAAMFRRIFEMRGGHVGQYPVLNFQYRIVAHIRSLVGRLAIQNRSFEAGGLEAITCGIEQARQAGDEQLAELFEAQRADEISHVRFANEWINAATRENMRSVMEIGTALADASKAFHQVMGSEGVAGVSYPADGEARREAGFTDTEVGLAIQLQSRPAGRRRLTGVRGEGLPRVSALRSSVRTSLAAPARWPARPTSRVPSTAAAWRRRSRRCAAARATQRTAPCQVGDVVFYLADGGNTVHRVMHRAPDFDADHVLTEGDALRARSTGAVQPSSRHRGVEIAGQWQRRPSG